MQDAENTGRLLKIVFRYKKDGRIKKYPRLLMQSGVQAVEKPLVNIKNGVSSVACSAGFASCKTFGKQPKHPCFGAKPPYRSSAICATASCSGFVWLTASILAWSRGGSPSNIAPFPGKGAWGFGKDAEIERPKALQDAKHTKRSYRDREFALSYKKRLFLQAVPPVAYAIGGKH